MALYAKIIVKDKEINKLLTEIDESRKKIQECLLRLEEMDAVVLEPSGPETEPKGLELSAPEKDAKGSEIVIEGGTIRLIVH